jgi:hypothetical protein
VNFSIESRIAEWNPLKLIDGKNQVALARCALSVPSGPRAHRLLFDGAYHEKTLNYDIGAFKDEPVGMLINNNRIVCDVKIDRSIAAGGRRSATCRSLPALRPDTCI